MNLPTIDEVKNLPPEEIPSILLQLASLQNVLTTILIQNNSTPPPPQEKDRLLDITEASKRIGYSKHWIYRRTKDEDGAKSKKSRKLPFVVRNGSSLRFSEQGIERWLRQKKTS